MNPKAVYFVLSSICRPAQNRSGPDKMGFKNEVL